MTSREKAEEIARDLFTSGAGGEVAHRLVLTSADGRDLGGWCFEAVVGRIEHALERPDGSPKLGDRSTCDHCERAIVFSGRHWSHVSGRYRHPARPKAASRDDETITIGTILPRPKGAKH